MVKESNVSAGLDPEEETLIREKWYTLIQETFSSLFKKLRNGEHRDSILYQCSRDAAKFLFEQASESMRTWEISAKKLLAFDGYQRMMKYHIATEMLYSLLEPEKTNNQGKMYDV